MIDPHSPSVGSTECTEPTGRTQGSVRMDGSVGLVSLVALVIAAWGVYPFAGSWNDGSRLAAIESLAERNTWIIDDSLFVFPNGPREGVPNPYDPASQGLAQKGTLDLMRIDGHFYSDKSPVPSLLLAGFWKLLRQCGAPSPVENPAFFCWTMGTLGAAMPFALGCGAIWALAGRLASMVMFPGWAAQLLSARVVLFLGGAIATMAPCYSRSINTHIMMWGIAAWVVWILVRVDGASTSRSRVVWGFALGHLLGLGYGVDLGIGPALALAVGVWVLVALRWQGIGFGIGLALGFLPWFGLHHALGYAIAGTWGPMNARPEFFQWPGSPFDEKSLTGGFKHPGVGKFLLYSGDMLFGKKGILFHEGVGLLGFLAVWGLARLGPSPAKGLSLFCRFFFLVGFLVYAIGSNNQSGLCRSVRWFLPLAVPLWYLATLACQGHGSARSFYPLLTILGLGLAAIAYPGGPWEGSVLPGYWVFAGFQILMGVLVLTFPVPPKPVPEASKPV